MEDEIFSVIDDDFSTWVDEEPVKEEEPMLFFDMFADNHEEDKEPIVEEVEQEVEEEVEEETYETDDEIINEIRNLDNEILEADIDEFEEELELNEETKEILKERIINLQEGKVNSFEQTLDKFDDENIVNAEKKEVVIFNPILENEFKGRRLALTNDELTKIAKDARQRKFKMNTETYLYPKTFEDDIKNFTNVYRFLENLALNLENTYPDISRKMHNYLADFVDKYYEAVELLSELNEDIHYGKDVIIQEARSFIKTNHADFTNFLNECFPIGMSIKEYDPTMSAGFL